MSGSPIRTKNFPLPIEPCKLQRRSAPSDIDQNSVGRDGETAYILGPGHGVLVVSPRFPAAAVLANTGDRHRAGNEHLATLDGIVFPHRVMGERVWILGERPKDTKIMAILRKSLLKRIDEFNYVKYTGLPRKTRGRSQRQSKDISSLLSSAPSSKRY